MIVVSRLRGRGGMGDTTHPFSRTMIYPPNRDRVATAARASGGWVQVTPLRGLGALDVSAVPTWGWVLGGLAVGGAAAFAYSKMRKRRK